MGEALTLKNFSSLLLLFFFHGVFCLSSLLDILTLDLGEISCVLLELLSFLSSNNSLSFCNLLILFTQATLK